MKQPTREPDYSNTSWKLWFDEMIIYGNSMFDSWEKEFYKMEEREEGLFILDFKTISADEHGMRITVLKDTQIENTDMLKAYEEFLIERQLLR